MKEQMGARGQMETPVKQTQTPQTPQAQPQPETKKLPTSAEFYQEFVQRADVRTILERLAK